MGLFRLATLCGVTIHCSHFEELTSFKGVGKKLGVFYAQSSGSPKLVLDAKSKTYDWFGEYFFCHDISRFRREYFCTELYWVEYFTQYISSSFISKLVITVFRFASNLFLFVFQFVAQRFWIRTLINFTKI